MGTTAVCVCVDSLSERREVNYWCIDTAEDEYRKCFKCSDTTVKFSCLHVSQHSMACILIKKMLQRFVIALIKSCLLTFFFFNKGKQKYIDLIKTHLYIKHWTKLLQLVIKL